MINILTMGTFFFLGGGGGRGTFLPIRGRFDLGTF